MRKTLELRLGKGLIAFQADWKKFMGNKKLQTIPGLQVLNYQFKNRLSGLEEKNKGYRGIDSEMAWDLALLGDILKSRNHVEASVIEYRKAVKKSKSLSPVLHNKLAGTLIVQKKYEEAESLLHRSLKFYPMFHTTLVNLGELYYNTQRYQKALGCFEKAVRMNPFNPFVHLRLIKLYNLLDQPEKKESQIKLLSYIE